jgi:pyruvyltransferase
MHACHIVPWGPHSNFGDELGPPIIQRILELATGCSAKQLSIFNIAHLGHSYYNRSFPCLMSVGSLWRFVMTGDHLWGTGVAYDGTVQRRCEKQHRGPPQVHNLTIYSSRGPKSTEQISRFCPWASNQTIASAGDAGVLVPYLFPEYLQSKEPTQEYCIIPHYNERAHQVFRQHRKATLSVQQMWENITLAIQDCRKVVSSSLHGIILAEAFNIPNRRLTLSERPGNFKFSDFYQSFRGYEPKHTNNLTEAVDQPNQPLDAVTREAYAKHVLKTFPMHLFQIVEDESAVAI